MTNLLAVDASGDGLSVALDAGGKIFSARRSGRIAHDEALLPAVEGALKRAKLRWTDLDAVAAAAGPGRFTGLRIGLSFAAMAGMQLDIPALALSRLEAAAEKSGAEDVVAALPGWKGEVYHQHFRRLKPVGKPAWATAADWPRLRAAAERKGLTVAFGETDAADLLLVARRRLATGKIPPFEPLYLKPAGYEKPRR